MSVFDYSIFGLRVRSGLRLPELFAASSDGEPDVRIEIAPVQEPTLDGDELCIVNGSLVLAIPDVARFQITGGNAITVDPQVNTPERNVRTFLLGSAFGALLHQRGLLPLHANAVEIDGKAVAFMGASGEGKSTLAAQFHDQGFRILADDVCVVKFRDDGRPYALPGLARLRLWQDALEASGRDTSRYERSYADDEAWNKFDVPVEHSGGASDEIELSGLYDLRRAEDLRIDQVRGVEAAEAVFAHTYRGSYVMAAKGELNHWQSCVRLVRSIPVFRLSRPLDLRLMGEVFDGIVEHVRTNLMQERIGVEERP